MFRKYLNDQKFLKKFLELGCEMIKWKTNDILNHCEVGKTKEFQGINFTHDKCYDRISKDTMGISEFMVLAYNIVYPDTSCYSGYLTKKQFEKRVLDLFKFYGIDIKGLSIRKLKKSKKKA